MLALPLSERLCDAGLRAEADMRGEKIGDKIREAQMQRVPYMLILGDKELENGTVSVRSRDAGDIGSMTEAEFTEKALQEVRTKAR